MTLKEADLHINIEKTKETVCGQETIDHNLTVDGVQIQNVTKFE